MINSEQIVTGEKIQLECDHFIGISGCIKNPRIHKEAQDRFLVNSSISNNFNNKPNVYCYTHTLNSHELVNILSKFKNSFNLFCHNSDHSFEEKHLRLFEKIPNLKSVLTQNKNVRDERVKILPIGIANSQWGHGNLQCWDDVLSQDTTKIKDFYFNFKIANNVQKRKECYDIISKKNIEYVHGTHYSNYLKTLKQYKFAFCPEGNGIDTHRFWECIYLRVVPIVLKNILVEELQKDLPVVILEKWEDFDAEKVITTYPNYSWNNIDKYTMDYYKDNYIL